MQNKIVFISWVSGSGKTVIIQELLKTGKFIYVPSYVTRELRTWEINGDKYNFISEEEFKKAIENWEFLEYELELQGWYYGTKHEIEKLLDGDKIPIKEVDAYGFKKIMDWWKLDGKMISIFLDVPENIMIKRMKWRDKIGEEELNKRIEKANGEREIAQGLYDCVLDFNGEKNDLDNNFDKIKKALNEQFGEDIFE